MSEFTAAPIGCLIMAAGNASRFGENKLAARFDGQSLFSLALAAIPAGLFARVTVVSQYPALLEEASRAGFDTILNDRPEDGISRTICNAVAMISGCICDGAKASCASKIAMGVDCGILGYDMYAGGNNFRPGDGILGADVEDTVRNVGVLAAQGMRETDRVILKIMTE